MNKKLILTLNTALIGSVLIGCKKENLPTIIDHVEVITNGGSSKPKETNSEACSKKNKDISSKAIGTKSGTISKPGKPVKTARVRTVAEKRELDKERVRLTQAYADKQSIVWLTQQNIENLTERIENGNYSLKKRDELIKERAAFEMTLLRSRNDEKEIGNQINKLDEEIKAIEQIDTKNSDEQERAARKNEFNLSVDQTKVELGAESDTDYIIDIEN